MHHSVYYLTHEGLSERLGVLRNLCVGITIWELGTGRGYFLRLAVETLRNVAHTHTRQRRGERGERRQRGGASHVRSRSRGVERACGLLEVHIGRGADD